MWSTLLVGLQLALFDLLSCFRVVEGVYAYLLFGPRLSEGALLSYLWHAMVASAMTVIPWWSVGVLGLLPQCSPSVLGSRFGFSFALLLLVVPRLPADVLCCLLERCLLVSAFCLGFFDFVAADVPSCAQRIRCRVIFTANFMQVFCW